MKVKVAELTLDLNQFDSTVGLRDSRSCYR